MSGTKELNREQFSGEKCGPVAVEEIDPQLVVVAYLMRRISELPKEALQDLSALAIELGNCETKDEYRGIVATFREILFPEELIGQLRNGPFPSEPSTNIEERKKWIGSKLRELRTEAGLNQEQLATKAGLPQSHISRLETGAHSPSFKTLEKVARALGKSVGDLDPSAE